MSTIQQDAKELRSLRKVAEDLDRNAKAAKEKATDAENLFFERMRTEDVESIKVQGTLFVPAETVYGQVQDSSEFVAWAEENSPELVEVKARKALVNELIRERLDTGEALPPGLGFYVKQYVSQRVG